MTISVVIPTYNGEQYVEEALLSVINQTRQADEIIISDDNSSDHTIEICSKYSNKICIHINRSGPSGFVNGWNNAVKHTHCDFVSILHQDDTLDAHFIEEMEKAIMQFPNVKHFFTPCKYIDAEGEIISTPDYCTDEIKYYSGREYVNAYQNIGHPHIHRCPGVVTHRDILNICKYNPDAGHIADDDFFYRVGQYTDVVGILKPLSFYRIHKSSETGHLENVELVRRLAHDYIYQLYQWKENNFMGKNEYEYFIDWARFYVQQEMIFCKKRAYSKILQTECNKNKAKLESLNIKVKNFNYLLKLFKYYISTLV